MNKCQGFTSVELLATVVLLVFFMSMQVIGLSNSSQAAKIKAATFYAQTWADEALRLRQGGTMVNGAIHQTALATRSVAPLYSPFNTPYQVTMAPLQIQVSFQVPYPVNVALSKTIRLGNGHTEFVVEPKLKTPGLSLIEKVHLYQEYPKPRIGQEPII